MQQPHPILLSFVLAPLAAGCAGSETGNGARETVPVQVVMELVAGPAGTFVAPDASGAEFVITAGATLVERLDFVLPEGGEPCLDEDDPAAVVPYEVFCVGDSGRWRVEGPWSIDLVTGEATPSLDALRLPVGPIERIEARLRPGTNDDWTLAVDGTHGADAFRLELRFGDVMRFEPTEGVTIGEALAGLALEFDPSAWFSELDLAACIAAGDVPEDDTGALRLDQGSPASCGNVEARVEQALRAAARLVAHSR